MNIINLLRSRVSYNPETGELVWREREPNSFRPGRYSQERQAAVFNAAHAGKPALNCPSGSGYLMGTFEGRPMKAHHAAWMIYHGVAPPPQIDHEDGNRTNNSIRNLRAADHEINARNRARASNNTSGCVGVYPKGGKWAAQIGGKNRVHLGTFTTIEEAIAARKAAEKVHGFHQNHGRCPHEH